MKKHLKALMIDDHPAILEGYKSILSFNKDNYTIESQVFYNCKDSYHHIVSLDENPYQLAFIDVTLPPYEEQGLKNGIDVAVFIRKKLPETKLIILTSHEEALVLTDILTRVKPEGLLVKSDFTAEELLVFFSNIIHGKTCFSKTVIQHRASMNKEQTYLDSYNRQIITLLAQGAKTKTLQEKLHLSRSAIDKRKVQIKQILGIEKGTDKDILTEARRKGWV